MTAGRQPLRELGIARACFGSLVLLRTTPLLAPLHIPYLEGTSPLLGWPAATWHVPAFGLALPPSLVAALCILRTLATILFTVGVRAGPAGLAGGVLGWIVLAEDVMSYVNTLHLLFLGMVVLAASGAGSTFALRPEPLVDPRSGLALTRALVASVYGWSGLAKLNASWLSGDALAQLHQSQVIRGVLAETLLTTAPSRAVAACTLAAIELALGPLLLWRRTRLVALTTALAMHLGLEISIHPDFFGFAMAALLLSFVGPHAITGTVRATQRSEPATR
jgi:Vitamin K-dependent gamma-carboxylase